MLLSVLKEGASSLCLIASLVSTQGIQTTILSDLLHSSSQAQIQLGPSLGIDLLYSPFPSTKSNYPLWNKISGGGRREQSSRLMTTSTLKHT